MSENEAIFRLAKLSVLGISPSKITLINFTHAHCQVIPTLVDYRSYPGMSQ